MFQRYQERGGGDGKTSRSSGNSFGQIIARFDLCVECLVSDCLPPYGL